MTVHRRPPHVELADAAAIALGDRDAGVAFLGGGEQDGPAIRRELIGLPIILELEGHRIGGNQREVAPVNADDVQLHEEVADLPLEDDPRPIARIVRSDVRLRSGDDRGRGAGHRIGRVDIPTGVIRDQPIPRQTERGWRRGCVPMNAATAARRSAIAAIASEIERHGIRGARTG